MFRFQPDRLKTKEKIGKGRFGTVFPYQKDSQDLKWVVKRIRAEDMDDFFTSLPEIVLGFSCDHPRLVPVKGYFIEKESNGESFNIYMKLPRMKMTLLDEFRERKRKNNPYSEQEITHHFYSLVSGIEYLHNKRIYHGDIKPDNLLLDFQGVLKIADVGIAKHVEEGDEYQTVTEKIGTYQYTAPEIMGSERKDIKKEILAKADIWGLGVVIMELCVFDFRLLNSLDREETRKRIENHLESLEGKFNNSLIALVKRILSSDPNERPEIGQIKNELEKNFSEIFSEDFLILGKGALPVNIDNDQINVLNKKIKEITENFDNERIQLKEIISQFESDLSQQKQQYEQKNQGQNHLNARQEQSQQDRILEEKIRGLEQELQQQKNQLLDHLNIIKDKENRMNDYEQKVKALEQREKVASERFEQEKKQLQRTTSQLEQNISQQKRQSEEKLRATIEQNNKKALNEKTVLEENIESLEERIREMEEELEEARNENQGLSEELEEKNGKLESLQKQIKKSQNEKKSREKKIQELEEDIEKKVKNQAMEFENQTKIMQEDYSNLQQKYSNETDSLRTKNAQLQKMVDVFQLEFKESTNQLLVKQNHHAIVLYDDRHKRAEEEDIIRAGVKKLDSALKNNNGRAEMSGGMLWIPIYPRQQRQGFKIVTELIVEGLTHFQGKLTRLGINLEIWNDVSPDDVYSFFSKLKSKNYEQFNVLQEFNVNFGLNQYERHPFADSHRETIKKHFSSYFGSIKKCSIT